MTARNRISRIRLIVVGITCILLMITSLPTLAAPLALPPRPTPEPTDQPVSGSGDGGAPIELRVHVSPAQLPHWQKVWTVVQWQDVRGNWHDVEGWRGSLDEIVAGEGRKTWWVYQQDLGKGPFHWQVYLGEGSRLLATSEAFNLPSGAGTGVPVEVALAP